MIRSREMKTFREMPSGRVAVIGIAVTIALVVAALGFNKIPGLFSGTSYQAYFAEVGNLRSGDPVELSGVEVGKVEDIRLDGDRVLIRFAVDSPVDLGVGTRVAITTTSALGKRALKVSPGGTGQLSSDTPLPMAQTISPYSLNDALNDAGSMLQQTDSGQADQALRTVSSVLDTAEPPLGEALSGVTGLSETIGSRDQQLRQLFDRTQETTAILAERSSQLNTLVLDANTLLVQLQNKRDELARLIVGTKYVAQQLSSLLQENRSQLNPALTELESVVQVLEDNKENIATAIGGLRTFSTGLGESIASGPFFTAYAANLFPVEYVQPLIDSLVGAAPGGGR